MSRHSETSHFLWSHPTPADYSSHFVIGRADRKLVCSILKGVGPEIRRNRLRDAITMDCASTTAMASSNCGQLGGAKCVVIPSTSLCKA